MEFRLLGAAALAVLVVYAVLRLEAGGGNAPGSARRLGDIALGSVVAGLIAGRLAAMILGGTNPIAHPGDILIVRGGVDPGVASLAALAALGVSARTDPWRIADGLAPAALAGLGGWHAGCVVRDTCLGTASNLPWAVAGPDSAVTRHPVEMYAALLLALAAGGLILWKRRPPPAGIIGGTALFLAAAIRLATEPLRLTIGGGPEIWYAAGMTAGVGIAAGRWWRGRSPA